MLQFSKHLASKGFRVTFVITTSSSKSIQVHANHSINVEIISDGSEEPENSEGIEAHLEHFKLNVSQSLAKLVEKHNTSKYPPKILAYDSILPWAMDIARQLGLDGAAFRGGSRNFF